MTLTPRGRALIAVLALGLLGLGAWALLDGPRVDGLRYAGPDVQCRSAVAGSDADQVTAPPLPDDGPIDVPDEPTPAQLLDAPVILEDEALGLTHDPPVPATDASVGVAAEQLTAADQLLGAAGLCDAARSSRLARAGGLAVPATVLLAVATLAPGRPSRPRVPLRQRFEVADEAGR